MTRVILAALLAVGATACGVTLPAATPRPLAPSRAAQTLPVAPVTTPNGTRQSNTKPAPVIIAGGNDLTGAYLSIDIRPNEKLDQLAFELRTVLHFLDMRQAIPPRPANEYHVTVGYFRSLERGAQQQLAQKWQHQTVQMNVTGWGVAQNQAAYFTIDGVDLMRDELKAMKVGPYEADPPHITFGVSEGKRQDVHGVPKPNQHPMPPQPLIGEVHLKQGTHVIW